SIMTKEVISVPPTASLDEAVECLHSNRVSCIVVCEDGTPLGLVSERDVVGIAVNLVAGELQGTVEEIMSSPLTTVSAEDTLEDALVLVEHGRIRHLPVVGSDGMLVGLLTQTDLLRSCMRHIDTLVDDRTLSHSDPSRPSETLSGRFGLLGIGSRREMHRSLAQIHAMASRYERPYAVLLCDVDYFAAYNRRYGHAAGDRVLTRVAEKVVEIARRCDQVYRYGADEIIVLLPETSTAGAIALGKRVHSRVEELAMAHADSPAEIVSLSFGVGSGAKDAYPPSWHGALDEAEKNLDTGRQERPR
ncbi:MAG: CBS domain-containing protein, partial [Myxococcota bacterium]